MRIKRLEIRGFKSFAERTVLNFDAGISGVVGPNGCGKSNIIDALRWCMGEMSAKHLRGRAMQDVIFSGSESRGPLGMAEVTLTLLNDGKDILPQYAAFTEIEVTRRLHRDGTSEYLINKVTVRLRDVTDLFLGTGVGMRAYAIIEQGRIAYVINSRPEERRHLIDEVAGITKFKARRRAAERRMESTQQNLLRLQDVDSELKRQLRSLRRQARAAERYKELRAELRDLDLHRATMKVLECMAQMKVVNLESTSLSDTLEGLQRESVAHEGKLEADRLNLVERDQAWQKEQAKSATIDAELAALERDLEHWQQDVEQTGQRIERAGQETEHAKERAAQIVDARVQASQQLEELEAARARDAETLHLLETSAADAQQGLADADTKIEQVRGQMVEHMHVLTAQRTELSHLDKRKIDLKQRHTQGQRERERLIEQRQDIDQRHAVLQAEHQEVEQQLEQQRDLHETTVSEQLRLQEQLKHSDDKLLACRTQSSEQAGRLRSLEAIAAKFEGYNDGVRRLFNVSDENDGEQGAAIDGVDGVVADLFTVDAEHEVAIEAALGERLQYLLVREHEVARQAVDILHEAGAGRCGFIPQSVLTASQPELRPALVGDGVLGSALDHVECQSEVKDMVHFLLKDVCLVRDLNAAIRLWPTCEAGQILVTLRGEVVDSDGVVQRGVGAAGASLLSERREIRQLQESVQTLETELNQAIEARRALAEQAEQLQEQRSLVENQLRDLERHTLDANKNLELMVGQKRHLTERLDVVEQESAACDEALQGVATAQQKAEALVSQAGELHHEAQAQWEQLTTSRGELVELVEQSSAALVEAKVECAARVEKLKGLTSEVQRLKQARTDIERQIDSEQRLQGEGQQRVTTLQVKITEGKAQALKLSQRAMEAHKHVTSLREACEQERLRLEQLDKQVRAERKQVMVHQERLNDLVVERQRLDLQQSQMIESMRERHDVELLKVMGDFHCRATAGSLENKRREQVERGLKNIGPINLTAIEECREVEERSGFLDAQREDLESALESLRQAMRRIDKLSRERFRDAFEQVNSMFRLVYPRLFGGGEARLELLQADDLLAAGVDIVVRPPGKRLQTVGLLSGGEKALTAVALVFSIFLVKPSPFCVLDEVDAPLDDINVGRFHDLLREIAKTSQAILITHNKQTMSVCDRLYGITMEEPGMSKVVSVDLTKESRPASQPVPIRAPISERATPMAAASA